MAYRTTRKLAALPAEGFDDIIYFGVNPDTIELLNDKLANGGIINIVTVGHAIPRPVSIGIGRIHYGHTRWIGTAGDRAHKAYDTIPATGELRPFDKVLIVGAGGPMGQMHVIRAICSGVPDIQVTAADVDQSRLDILSAKSAGLARQLHGQVAIRAPGTGPFSLASYVLGTERFLIELALAEKDPGGDAEQALRRLMGLTTQALTAFAKACLDAGAHLVQAGDSLASIDMISPRLYRKWAFPFERQFFTELNAYARPRGGLRSRRAKARRRSPTDRRIRSQRSHLDPRMISRRKVR